MTLQSINPATGELVVTYEEMSSSQVESIVASCHRSFLDWRNSELTERSRLLTSAGELLRQRIESLAELMTREMGKPIAQSRAEVEKCAPIKARIAAAQPLFPVKTTKDFSYRSRQIAGAG